MSPGHGSVSRTKQTRQTEERLKLIRRWGEESAIPTQKAVTPVAIATATMRNRAMSGSSDGHEESSRTSRSS